MTAFEITTQTTFFDHLQAEALEKKYLPPEIVASAQTTWGWNLSNPEGLFLMRQQTARGPLVGHLSAFPIRKDFAVQLASGALKDTELPPQAVLPYGSGEPSDLYFAIVCIDKAFRPRALLPLLAHFTDFLKEKLNANPGMEFILAEAGSPEGQKLIERHGFQKCNPGQSIPCYYRMKLGDLLQRFSLPKSSPGTN